MASENLLGAAVLLRHRPLGLHPYLDAARRHPAQRCGEELLHSLHDCVARAEGEAVSLLVCAGRFGEDDRSLAAHPDRAGVPPIQSPGILSGLPLAAGIERIPIFELKDGGGILAEQHHVRPDAGVLIRRAVAGAAQRKNILEDDLELAILLGELPEGRRHNSIAVLPRPLLFGPQPKR